MASITRAIEDGPLSHRAFVFFFVFFLVGPVLLAVFTVAHEVLRISTDDVLDVTGVLLVIPFVVLLSNVARACRTVALLARHAVLH